MTTKRVRISKQEFNKIYRGLFWRAMSGAEVDEIARRRDCALYRPSARKPQVRRKAVNK